VTNSFLDLAWVKNLISNELPGGITEIVNEVDPLLAKLDLKCGDAFTQEIDPALGQTRMVK
jgi:hypothetical protein